MSDEPPPLPVDTWTPVDMGDQAGRTAVVTGPSPGGVGYHVALELARRGARVVLAGRDEGRLAAAADAIAAELDGDQPRPERVVVDLTDLASVRSAADRVAADGAVDLLVNNAGVMAPPRRRTADGPDLQLTTNHLGPFLLTGSLLPVLVATGQDHQARVVTVTSLLHRRARRAPGGNGGTRHAGPWQTYAQTKLANLLFTHGLERRARDAGLPLTALAAHPGLAATHLLANGRTGGGRGPVASVYDAAVRAVAQPAAQGAWPVLMAATADLPGASCCGPAGPGGLSGAARVVGVDPRVLDERAQDALWSFSEDAVGLRWP